MPLDNNMRAPNPNPHRSGTISILTLINYANDSSYAFQTRAQEILDGLRRKGMVSDKEVEKASKTSKESAKDRVGDGGVKQDDEILQLSDNTILTKDLLNTPSKLKIVEDNKNNLEFLPLIPYIDEKELHRFVDSDSPQIRHAVAEKISVEELNKFFDETNESVLNVIVDRIDAISGEKLLKKNKENLSFEQVEKLNAKIGEMNDFAKVIEDADTITDNMWEKINKLDGADFEFVMETLRPKFEEDKELNFVSKLNPQKLAGYFSNETQTDGQWNPETPIQKEERTGKVKVYRGGDFKDKRGYVSLSSDFAEEFGTVDEWEIDKNKILDVTNSEHRDMIEARYGSDMLNKLSPDGELPFAGNEDVLDDIEKIATELGFVGSAQSEGEGLPVSFDIYNSNELEFPTPDRIERPSLFGSDAESVDESLEKISKLNYEGILKISAEAKDEDNQLFDKNPKLREKIASKLKPEDVATFADDKDKQVRMQVAKNIEDKQAREYVSGESDPDVLAEYIKKLRDGDITDEMMFHSSKDVRIATSEVIKNPVKLDRMLKHEVGLERGNRDVLNNILDSFKPEQFKSIVEPLYNKTKNWDLKNALRVAINPDKFKTKEDFENLTGFVKKETDPEILTSVARVVPEEVADEHFSPDFMEEYFDYHKIPSIDMGRMVEELSVKQSPDNIVENYNKYIDYINPEDINGIVSNSKFRERFEKAGRIDDYNSLLDGLISYSKNPMIPRYSHTPIAVPEAKNENDVYVYRKVSKAELENVLSGKDKTGEFWTSAPQSYVAGREGDFRVVSIANNNPAYWLGRYMRPENYPTEITYEGLKAVRKENPNYKSPSKAKTHFEQIGQRSKDDIVAVYDHKGNKVYSRDEEIIPDFSSPKFQSMYDAFGKAITYQDAENIVRQYFNDDEIDIQRATRIFTEHRAFGVYMDGVIGFIENPDISTPYHESVHAYLDNFYTFEEKQELYDEIRKLEKNDELSDAEAEEKVADMFFPYVKGKETVTGKIKDYFDKAINFIKGLVGKEDKIKKLFRDIESKKRPISNVTTKRFDPEREVQMEYYQQPKALTTKLFKMRETQKESMSMQEVRDLIKSKVANLKKNEKQLLNRVLDEQFANQKRIKVEDFENAVAQSLLPLNIKDSDSYSDYGMENLGEWSSNVKGFEGATTHIFEFPEDIGVGGHFTNQTSSLFGHTRIWSTKDINYVAEIQSDFYQKYRGADLIAKGGSMALPYKNSWFERMIREEIRNSAVAGKSSLRFPHPFTVAMIEGYTTGRAPYTTDWGDDYVGHGAGITYLGKQYTVVELDNYSDTFEAVPDEYIEEQFNISEKYREEIYDNFVEVVKGRGFNQIELIENMDEISVMEFTTLDGKQYVYSDGSWSEKSDPSYSVEPDDILNDYNDVLEAQNKFAVNIKKEILNRETHRFLSFAGRKVERELNDISDLSTEEYNQLRQEYLEENGFDIQIGFFSQWDWDKVDLNDYKHELEDAIRKSGVGDAKDYFERKYGDLISFDREGGYGDDEYAVLMKEGWSKNAETLKMPYLYSASDMDEDEYVDNISEKYSRLNKKKAFITSRKRAESVRDIPIQSFKTSNGLKIIITSPYSTKGVVGNIMTLNDGEQSPLDAEVAVIKYNEWIKDASDYEIQREIENDIEYHEKIDEQEAVVMFYEKQVLPYLKSNRTDLKKVTDENGNTWYETKLTPDDRGAVEAFQEFAPAFYSRLEAEVKNIQGDNIKVSRIPNLLRNISQDEIKWSGIDEFIKYNTINGRIKKEALIDYLKENNTKVDLKFGLSYKPLQAERGRDNIPPMSVYLENAVKNGGMDYTIKEIRKGTFSPSEVNAFISTYEFTDEEFDNLLDILTSDTDYSTIRGEYDLGGMLYSINLYEGNKLTDAQKQRFYAEKSPYSNKDLRSQYIQPLGGKYVEAVVTSNKAEQFKTDTVHFGQQEDQISWFRGQRLDHPELGKVLHIDEVQSRRHDMGREEGYRNTASDLNKQLYDTENEIRKLVKEKDNIYPSASQIIERHLGTGNEEDDKIIEVFKDWMEQSYVDEEFVDDFFKTVEKNTGELSDNMKSYMKEISEWAKKDKTISKQISDLNEKAHQIERERAKSYLPTVAPFEDYVPITLKNALRYCAENQIDGITISTPKQIKHLYNLSRQISGMEVNYNEDGTVNLHLWDAEGFAIADQDAYNNITPDRLKELIGKEPANKILNKQGKDTTKKWDDLELGDKFIYKGKRVRISSWTEMQEGKKSKTIEVSPIGYASPSFVTKEDFEKYARFPMKFEGEEIDMGGEWADEMYGNKIPNWLNKYMKKLGVGVQLEEKEIAPGFVQPYLRITGELSNKVLMEGQSLFQKNPYEPAIKELLKSTPKEEWNKFYNHENEYVREAVVRQIDTNKLDLFMNDDSPIVRDALYEKVNLENIGLLYEKDADVNSLPALRQRLSEEMLKDGFDPNMLWQFTNSKDPLLAEIAQSVDFTDKNSILEASEKLKDEDNIFRNERGIEEPDADKVEQASEEYKEPDTEKIEVEEVDYDVDPTLAPEVKLAMVSDTVIEDGVGEAYKLKNMLDKMGFQRSEPKVELKETIADKSQWKRLQGRDYSIPLRDAEKAQFKIMNNLLKDVKSIVGDDIRLVGGATRDLLMRQAGITDKIINDLDFTVPTYKQVEKLTEYFRNHPDYGVDDSGLKFSHVKIIHKDTKFEFEFTSYRKEAYHDTSRKPEVVEGSFEDEIKRRDFSINTIFAKISDVDENGISIEVDPETEDFIDDINKGIIRTVDSPDKVFYDDPLRMLRALRFASRYNFEIDPDVIESIQKFDPQMFNKVSGERIRDEFSKVLRTGNDMFANQIIAKVFPELNELYEQSDVIDHINRAVKLARKYDDDVLLWTALLHDVGKMKTAKTGKDGETIHPGHAESSSELIKPILDRLKLSRQERKAIEKLVSIHSRYKELDKMKLGKVIDFAIENERVFPYLVKFQDIDYFAHAGNFFDRYPEQTNFDIISRMSGIYSVLKQIPAEEKSKWQGSEFRSKLKNYISNDLKYREAYDNGSKALYKLYDRKEPIINEPYLAPNGELSKLTTAQWKQSRTPEFKNWFGDWQNDPENSSKVVDDNGEPKIVYHGTVSNVEEFDMDRISLRNYFGKGIYFSSSIDDVNINYASESSPDRQDRIEYMKEIIYGELEGLSDEEIFSRFGMSDEEKAELNKMRKYENADTMEERQKYYKFVSDYTRKHVMDEITERLAINAGPNVMPSYLNIKNPAIIDEYGNDSTMIQIELEYDENDKVIGEGGNGVELMDAILSVAPDFGLNGDNIWHTLMESIGDRLYGGIGLNEIDKALRNIDELWEAYYDDEATTPEEFIRQIYEYMGFDGIIQKNADMKFRMNMLAGTNHYIAFNPNQVKSAIANKGTFSKSYNVLYQERARGDEEYPTLTPQELDEYTKETYKMLQGVIPVTMEDMDRDNGKAVLNGLKSIITIDPRTAHEGTFYHETLHIATEILGEEKAWNQFLQEAGWDGVEGSESWREAQEKLADEFMQYKLERKKYEENHPYKAMFDKVGDFFKRIGDFFAGKKEYNKADYFYKLSKGKLQLRSQYEKNIQNYPISSQIAYQRNMSIPPQIKDAVINTELKSFGKNASKKPILRGSGGMIKLDDDFYRHLAGDGVKKSEIDLYKFIIEKEGLQDEKISPEDLKNLVSEYLYPMKIQNSYGEVFYETPDSYLELYEGQEEIYKKYCMLNGKLFGRNYIGQSWEVVDENKIPIDILDGIYKLRDENDSSNYYGTKGALGYGLQAQGGEGYREINLSLPFTLIESHPEFTDKNTLGWFRTDIDINNPRRLRVNELQSDVFQKTRMPKEWDDLKVGDNFVKNGEEFMVVIKGDGELLDKDSIIITSSKNYVNILKNKNESISDLFNNGGITFHKEAYEKYRNFYIQLSKNSKLIQNLQPTWHEYFINSIIQNAYNSNFDEISFPTGDTIGKIEGFDKIDELIEKHKKEIKLLNKEIGAWERLIFKIDKISDKEDLSKLDDSVDDLKFLFERWGFPYHMLDNKERRDDIVWKNLTDIKRKFKYNSTRALEDKIDNEYRSLEHFEKAKKSTEPIKDFYENKIAKYLQKTKKGRVEKITDKFGQTWYNVALNETDGSPIELYQRKSFNKLFRISTDRIKNAFRTLFGGNTALSQAWTNWFVYGDVEDKPMVAHIINSNPEIKNATINNFYQKYVEMIKIKNQAVKENPELGKEIDIPLFEDFVKMEIPVYKTDMGDNNAFESYTLIKPSEDAEEIPLIPSKTLGLVDYEGSTQILVPTEMQEQDYKNFIMDIMAKSENAEKLSDDAIVKERGKAKDYKGVYERMLDLELNKGQLKIGITPATSQIEEIDKLLKRSSEFAEKGNFNKVKEYNAKVLEFGVNWLDEKFEGKTDVSFEVNNAIGLFGGWEEPTMDMSASFDEENKKDVFNSIIDFAEDFKQENIHISKELTSLPEGASLGEINPDGSTYQMDFNISFKTPLTREQINKLTEIFNKNNLPGFTLNEDNTNINFYNTTTEGEKGYEDFIRNSTKLIKKIESFENFGNVTQGFRQLWNWGNPEFGATATFEQARSQVLQQPKKGEEGLEQVESPTVKELLSKFDKFEKPKATEIGSETKISLSNSTDFEITPMGKGVMDIRIMHKGALTDEVSLYGSKTEEFKNAVKTIAEKHNEILNKFKKETPKKLFPFFSELEKGSLVYADDDMFYISNKDKNRVTIAQLGTDGNIISYKDIEASKWEQTFSGLEVKEKAGADILPELDFESLTVGTEVDSPFFGNKFKVISKNDKDIEVVSNEAGAETTFKMSRGYFNRVSQRGAYANAIAKVTDKLNAGDINPKANELVNQKPKRLNATFGSGAGNTSYFCKDEEGNNIALFKPSATETLSQFHTGIKPGTQFVREVASSQINDVFGFDVVPKAIFRTINGMVGSYQEFVQDSKTLAEYKEDLVEKKSEEINKLIQDEGDKIGYDLMRYAKTIAHIPFGALLELVKRDSGQIITPTEEDALRKSQQKIVDKIKEASKMNFMNDERFMQMYLFDYITGNSDRHAENVLVDKNGNLYAIDNGYSLADYDGINFFRDEVYIEFDDSMMELKNSKFKKIREIYKNLNNIENINRIKEKFYDTGILNEQEFNGLVSRIYTVLQGTGILYNYIDEYIGTHNIINQASDLFAGMSADDAINELKKVISD